MSAIVAVRVDHVRVPFRVPFATAAGTWTARDSWLLRVTSPDGRTGCGEAVLDPGEATVVLEALLDELLAGGLPPAPALVSRAGAAGRAFRSAIDGARMDIDAPVGAQEVAVNATIGAGDAEEMAAAAQLAVEAGFRTLKLKAGDGDLVARVVAVRDAVGPGVGLRVDLNGTWDLATAVDRLAALAPLGITYVEQPLPADALGDMAALRRRVSVPIAADEAVDSVAGALAVLDARAADVLVVKPARVGGPRAVGEIASAAAEQGVPVVISSLFETGVGLATALACAASLPDVPGWPAADRPHGIATAGLLEHDLLLEPFVITGGRMRVPGGPGSGGLGIRLDEAAVARYRVERP